MKSEFEEKSYELGFNLELAEGQTSRTVFAPGQFLEGAIGFDVAWQLGVANPAWRTLGLSSRSGFPIPSPKSGVPTALVFNLFVQYKRSEYLKGWASSHLTHFGGPYFRFRFDDPASQLGHLKDLERGAGSFAHVIYAAPEFHKLDDLVNAFAAKTVISQSVVVRPSELNAAHTAYNFRSGFDSIQNPEPEQLPRTTALEFFEGVGTTDAIGLEPTQAIEAAQSALSAIQGWQSQWASIRESTLVLEGDLGPDRALALHYLEVLAFAWLHGLTWLLMG